MGYLYFRLFNNAYIYHPYHWTPIGFKDDIDNWSIEDIRAFHKKYYSVNNAVLVVAGDFKKEDLFKYAKKYFSKIKKGEEIKDIYTKEPPQDGEKIVVLHKDTQVEMLALAYHIPEFNHSDMFSLNVISEILSDGKSSRLKEELIDKKQLVNQIYAYAMDMKDPGLFLIIAVCNPKVKAQDVKEEILKEINKLKESVVSKEELDKIKINTKASLIYSMENSSNVTAIYGSYFARGDIKPLMEYEKNINSLTPQLLKDIANKYFNKNNLTTIILKGKESNE